MLRSPQNEPSMAIVIAALTLKKYPLYALFSSNRFHFLEVFPVVFHSTIFSRFNAFRKTNFP